MTPGVWSAIPVFISSTFRDMHAERDQLQRFVFPILRERLRQRRCYLEPVDLRWGVPVASSSAQEQAHELSVIKVCFDEIQRCGYVVIGLVGDRYGWVPPDDRVRALKDQFDLPDDAEGRSITELELLFALRGNPNNVLLYLREPLPYAEMPERFSSRLSSAQDPALVDPRAHAAVGALRQRLLGRHAEQVRPYRVSWNAAAGRLEGLDRWGEAVVDDLWRILEPRTRQGLGRGLEGEDPAPDTFELDQFVAERQRVFLGRDYLLEDVAELVDDTPKGLVLAIDGAPGIGKSAVFAALRTRLATPGTLVLDHAVGIGTDATSPFAVLERWNERLLAELDGRTAVVDDATPFAPSEARERFAELIGRRAILGPAVLLIDGIDHIDRLEGRWMEWLPQDLPGGVRVVVTLESRSLPDLMRERPHTRRLALPGLDSYSIRSVVAEQLRLGGRTIEPDVLAILLDKRNADGAEAASSPLWLTTVLSEIGRLDETDFSLTESEARASGSSGERLAQLLAEVARSIPGDIEGLYGWILERAERAHGRRLLQGFLGLTGASRTGLRDGDYDALLATTPALDWNPLKFAALRELFRAHVVQRGRYGQWTFAHGQMRRAVQERWFVGGNDWRRLHRKVALHLMSLPDDDPLRITQTFHHLMEADAFEMAAVYCANRPNRAEAREIARDLSRRLDEEGTAWIDAFLAQDALDRALRWSLCEFFVHDVTGHLFDRSGSMTILATLQSVERALLASAPSAAAHDAASALLLNGCRGLISDILGTMGRAEDAFGYDLLVDYTTVLASDGANDEVLSGEVNRHRRIGDYHRRKGDVPAAHAAYASGVEVARRLAEQPGGDTRQLLIMLGHVASLEGGAREDEDAPGAGLSPELEEMRDIAERNASEAPDDRDARRDLQQTLARISGFHLKTGNLKDAFAASFSAYNLSDANLDAEEPDSIALLGTAAYNVSLCFLTGEETMGGDAVPDADAYEVIRRYLDRSQAAYEFLVERDPQNAMHRYNLVTTLQQDIRCERLFERADREPGLIDECLVHLRWLGKRDPGNVSTRNLMRDLSLRRCARLSKDGHVEQAMDELLDALGLERGDDGALPAQIPGDTIDELVTIAEVADRYQSRMRQEPRSVSPNGLRD